MEPSIIAFRPSRWQASRATARVSRVSSVRPIERSVSPTRWSETMSRNGDCPSWTSSAVFSVSSNTGLPVLFSKAPTRIVSRSVRAEPRCPDHVYLPMPASRTTASTAATP